MGSICGVLKMLFYKVIIKVMKMIACYWQCGGLKKASNLCANYNFYIKDE